MSGAQGLPILKFTESDPELMGFIQEGSSSTSEVGGCGNWTHGVWGLQGPPLELGFFYPPSAFLLHHLGIHPVLPGPGPCPSAFSPQPPLPPSALRGALTEATGSPLLHPAPV